MSKLTWDAFKAAVEKLGVEGTEEIWFIDVDAAGALEIKRHPKCGVSIVDKEWS